MEIRPLFWFKDNVRVKDEPRAPESRVLEPFAAQGEIDAALLRGLDWQTQIVYRNIVTSTVWGPVAAALTCQLLGIDARSATAQGGATLESSAAAIGTALARYLPGIQGDWIRQFDDASPLCFDGRRFGVWREGCPDWSPRTQRFGGLCHALCAAAWKCDIASVEDTQIGPLQHALPALILETPGAAAAALSAVLDDGHLRSQRRLSPMQALTLAGTLLAGGAGMALAWPAAPLLAGAMEAAAAGVMLWSVPHGPDPTERVRLAAWFSNVLPELTVDQIHRLCDRLQGCDARLNVVVLAAVLQQALHAGSGGSPDEAIEHLDIREIEQEAIDRDRNAQSLDRFTTGSAWEAGLHLLHNVGFLTRASVEITTRPFSLRVADWYALLDRMDHMDHETPPSSRVWGGVSAVESLAYREVPQTASLTASPSSWPSELEVSLVASICGAVFRTCRDPHVGFAVAGTTLMGVLTYLVHQFGSSGADGSDHTSDAASLSVPLALPVADRRDPADRGYFATPPPPPVRPLSTTTASALHNVTVHPAAWVDVRSTLTLEQMVTLSEWVAWDNDTRSTSALRTYQDRTLAYMKRLVQGGYDAFVGTATEVVDWDARVEVMYQEVSYLPASAGSASGAGMRSRRTFSLMQIALGHHYYEESMSVGGSRQVTAIRLATTANTPPNSRTQAQLNVVNTDKFRAALHKLDLGRIDELSRSPASIAAFSRYVRLIFIATHARARTPGSPDSAFWVSPKYILPPREELERSLKFELLSFRGEIVPGIVALRHEASATALLVSVKRRTWFWWRREVESNPSWRDFMRDHLSMLDAERLNDPLRIDHLQFAIGPVCQPSMNCRRGNSSVRPPRRLSTPPFTSIWRADFAFTSHPEPEAALWAAEVRKMRQDLDMQIVTPELRARRDWQQFRKAMVQSWSAWFPIVNGVLPASAMLPDWAFRLGCIGATAMQITLLLESAETATLKELRAIHADMGFATVLMAIGQVPAADPFMKVGRSIAISGTAAAKHVIAHLKRWADSPVTIAGARQQLAASARALTDQRVASTPQTPPWIVVNQLKSGLGMTVAQCNASQAQTVGVNDFLGRGARRVTSSDLLTRLPAGYAVALAWADGRVLYAGVTCGIGTIAGQSVDDTVMLLPHGGFDMLDIFGDDRSTLTFQSDGRVMCDDYVLDMWVESLEDAIPVLELRRGELETFKARLGDRHLDASATRASPKALGSEEALTRPPVRWHTRTDPDAPTWEALVQQWRALRSGNASETASAMSANSTRIPGPVPVPTDSGTTRQLSDVPRLRAALAKHWTSRFETAFADVLARVETGLLLWHLGRLPTAQQRLVLGRLQQKSRVATIQADGIGVPGITAMRDDRAYLLLSLTTGEVLYGDDVAHIVADLDVGHFLCRHLSNSDAASLACVPTRNITSVTGCPPLDLAFQPPAQGFQVLAARAHVWMTEQITCARKGAPYCDPVARNHDLLYLVAAAAQRIPGANVASIVDLVRHSDSPGDRDTVPVEHIFRSENASHWHGTPSLPFAYYLGNSVRGVEAQLFNAYAPTEIDIAELVTLVSGHIVQSRQRYAVRLIHDAIADLVEFGVGNDRFGQAMLSSSESLRAGRFGPARTAVGDDVLPGVSRQDTDEDARRIRSVREMKDLPAGYEILLRSDAPIDETQDGLHHAMLSLGGGEVAAWFRSNGTTTSPMAYRRLDLLSGNDLLNFTASGVALTNGTPVELWIEPGASGVFSETSVALPQSLPVKDIGILTAMKRHPMIDAEIQRNSVDEYRGFAGDKASLLIAMARLLMPFGVVRIKYRVVLSWSTPDQVIPAMSLTLTGQTPPSMFAEQAPTEGTEKAQRFVVDLFMSRLLGGAVSRVGDVQSEAQWLATYRAHGGKRCIKYREFDDVSGMLAALPEYERLPGVRPYDRREATQLIQYPEWDSAPAPGWHPNRRTARRHSI
ncbi:hypothetical protein [Pandoraea sp. ISTKB]|uniref:hypothetical protein n=1 Tax=Pandoraea sp. ISTKB TaxID=1586708 RepID=UPI0008477BA8|nr:hypothetical protein [Pandoraea sp. ISTKB]ODP34666.1 hypothetical protein A9762_13690 [Pandoraea sp. ISTKB]